MGAPGIHAEKIKYDNSFLLLTEIFMFQKKIYSAVQFMNTNEENNQQEEMTTPTPEVNFVLS